MDSAVGPDLIRFGLFEVDTRAHELRRRGHLVALQQQPYDVLRALLESPGQVVTRDALRARLWTNGAYVDFDRSINKAMVRLREALGDDADSPRFIETLPRHGYRFIGSIELVAGAVRNHAPTQPDVVLAASVGALPAQLEAFAPQPEVKRRTRAPALAWMIGAAAVIAMTALAVVLVPRAPRSWRVENSIQLTHSSSTKIPQLVGDGKTLYFAQMTDGASAVMRVPTVGGEGQTIEFGLPDLYVYALSPDGTALLGASIPPEAQYEPEHPLWILPLRGGAPRTLGQIKAHGATWARGGQIYFCAGHSIGVVATDGSGAHTLFEAKDTIIKPRISPDGRQLRFSVYQGAGRWALWEADIEGHSPHPLLPAWNDSEDTCCGEWTADGANFVFEAKRGDQINLWATDERPGWFGAKELLPMRLGSGPMSLRAPLPSHDNRTVFAIGEQRQAELVRYDASRSEFVPFLGGISAEGVSFSGDGQWVAFVSYPQGDLWRSRIDGSDRRQLTFPPFAAVMPSWSPDGRILAFSGREEVDLHWQIYLVPVDGGNPQPVTAEGHDQFLGSWSPDGSSLVVGGFPTDPATSLRLIDVASRKVTTLPESAAYAAPTFSPDGKHVYAGAINPKRLMDFDLGIGRWSEVFRGTFKYWSFSHDFRFLYFDRGLGSNPGIYRVPMAGGEVEKVASLEHVRRTVGLAGPWFDLAPDDSPILLRNISSQQIYALALTRP